MEFGNSWFRLGKGATYRGSLWSIACLLCRSVFTLWTISSAFDFDLIIQMDNSDGSLPELSFQVFFEKPYHGETTSALKVIIGSSLLNAFVERLENWCGDEVCLIATRSHYTWEGGPAIVILKRGVAQNHMKFPIGQVWQRMGRQRNGCLPPKWPPNLGFEPWVFWGWQSLNPLDHHRSFVDYSWVCSPPKLSRILDRTSGNAVACWIILIIGALHLAPKL